MLDVIDEVLLDHNDDRSQLKNMGGSSSQPLRLCSTIAASGLRRNIGKRSMPVASIAPSLCTNPGRKLHGPARLHVRCRGAWHASSRLWDGWIGYTGGSGGQQPLIFDIHGEPLGRWWVPHGCHCGATLRPMSAWETVDANASEAKGSCYGMLTPHPVGLKTTPCRQRSH